MHLYCVLCGANSNIQVHIIKPGPHVNIVQSKYIINHGKKGGMYSQFFQIGEVLEYIGWKLSDVVHAQVTVETKNQLETLIETFKSAFVSLAFKILIKKLCHRRLLQLSVLYILITVKTF